MREDKKSQFDEVGKTIAKHLSHIEKIELDIFTSNGYREEYIVVTFRGGHISVRNAAANSLTANIGELALLLNGDYYKEVETYKELKNASEIKGESKLGRFNERIEQDYKDIYWYITLEGTVDAGILFNSGEVSEILEIVANEVAKALYNSGPYNFDEYERLLVDMPYYGFSAELYIEGWEDLSLSAQASIYSNIAEAIEQGETHGSLTVPDFFDEEDDDEYDYLFR